MKKQRNDEEEDPEQGRPGHWESISLMQCPRPMSNFPSRGISLVKLENMSHDRDKVGCPVTTHFELWNVFIEVVMEYTRQVKHSPRHNHHETMRNMRTIYGPTFFKLK